MFEALLMIAGIYLIPTAALIAFAFGMDLWVTRSLQRDGVMSDPYGKVEV